MARLLFLLFFCGLLLSAERSQATHIVGGEMGMQHLRDSTYALNLIVYFDGVTGDPGALDGSLTAAIYEKGTNRFVEDVVLPLQQNTLVDYSDPACSSARLVTRRLVYTRNLVLRRMQYRSPAGYYAVVERCCRNRGIANIQNPGGPGRLFWWSSRRWCRPMGRHSAIPAPVCFRPSATTPARVSCFTMISAARTPTATSWCMSWLRRLTATALHQTPSPTDRPPLLTLPSAGVPI
ncbi:hypothetical protein LRS06_00350 [Hymenobacter sp. J193]|uniref:hypothetical protein n=1 Tax=Hymenobacter sp. J193 TaxID=2898429 RepID=UPI002150A992|nr:hypothetical protein [Hymenobacter sp. J193]MCR5886244.1 hypothetical protein [Hymenobacter sp. J193]